MDTRMRQFVISGFAARQIWRTAALLTAALLAACLIYGGAAAQSKGTAQPVSAKKSPGEQQGSSQPQTPAKTTPSSVPRMASSAKPDLTKTPTLYVVGYAHLDTEWRWEYPQVISEYLAKTLHDNFALFEKYPHYIFNFSGANRYMMFKEYYPADFAKLKDFVAKGRWYPAGSSMEESDVNSPSAESIFRQILYGNEFFRHELGKASAEYMLPDCFGFPASLPSILAHAGIKGFSTQKLTWGSSAEGGPGTTSEDTPIGIPFNVGWWQGPDGHGVIAAWNPGSYSADITYDLTKASTAPARDYVDWPHRIDRNGEVSGLFTDYHYYGTGDTGGSPRENSVKLLEAIVTKGEAAIPIYTPGGRGGGQGGQQGPPPMTAPVKVGDGPVHVVSSNADQMFLDIPPSYIARMPRYSGDLELTNHSAGSLSSETYRKRWNRQNELLADAAERASVAADWLGGRAYPMERLNRAWALVMGGQFHDIMAGTATPKAYEYSWNDDVLAMNQFAGVMTSATESIASEMDTRGGDVPVVVYNPLNIAREDVVEARVGNVIPHAMGGMPRGVKVIGPDGKEVPSQMVGNDPAVDKILFLAKSQSVGFSVYNVVGTSEHNAAGGELKVTDRSIENARYRVTLNDDGDVSSIFDKKINRELLSAPIRLAFMSEHPHDWPAWNMDYADQIRTPRGYLEGPAHIRIVEQGPVRAAIEVERDGEHSHFVQDIRLSAGDAGNRVEFSNVIDWLTQEMALMAVFPLTANNPEATYNWDIGTVARGNDEPRNFEYPSHQWFDLTDGGAAYGVTILSDCKYASDKPDNKTLRLTLIYTPGLGEGNGRAYIDQISQDLGHHEFVFGLAGHASDWREAETDWQAYRLNQPLIGFVTSAHAGALGKSFSVLKTNNSRIRVLALKKAELSNEIIVRAVEMEGIPQPNVHIGFAAPVAAAREVNAQEQPLGAATIANGELVTSFGAYQPRTFAIRLAAPAHPETAIKSQPVTLTYDRAVSSKDGEKPAPGFDDAGHAIPAEMLAGTVTYGAIQFKIAPGGAGKADAVTAKGQTINLPAGKFNRVYILAASSDGDQKATFRAGDASEDVTIENWGGFIGQWDDRMWTSHQEVAPLNPNAPQPPPGTPPRMRTIVEYAGLNPGFIKRAPVAWFASHHHNADGTNAPYSYSYLFAYTIDLPAGAKTITLPANDKIRILAISVADETPSVWPAHPLYDTLERDGQ
ncbi:MAG TPA: glycoside hydrolase family 38 C-terminal domain-containing protein [Candidatus Acidoferrum sp.]|nr:glycoside hydrolase family 38 C-terminal domain-containing protein [Candidatus Acidoferrum sp.]